MPRAGAGRGGYGMGENSMVTIDIPLSQGVSASHIFGRIDDHAAPIVLLFMDGFGPRPTLFAIAERLAGEGYRVVLPDLFYRHQPFVPLEPGSLFGGGPDRQRIMTMLSALDQPAVDGDIARLLSFCDGELGTAASIGAVGYCLGGRYALTAATASARVTSASSFHGSNLAPETGDGAYARFADVRASIYVGIAAIDPTFGGAEEGRLAAALRDAKVDHMIEIYAGAAHGFVMDDLPVYHPAAAARHWQRLTSGLRNAFV